MKRRVAFLLVVLLLLTAIAAPALAASGSGKVVRVGWYESPFNRLDQFGRRSGYAYEYQQRIANYAGWTYEYVEGTWPELLAMLENGEIDLMSDVSYTEERAEKMLFSTLPMGTEEYYAFVAPDNSSISATDPSTFNGKTVGINKNSVQKTFFEDWAARNGVSATIREMEIPEQESIALLGTGELDVFVTLDAFGGSDCVPICKIGSSKFYFAVSNNRPDLLAELDNAMSRIQSEDRYYNQRLYQTHILSSGVSATLTPEEKQWLENHGTIRVGYRENYLAFCATDPQTGELTGALQDFLHYAETCIPGITLSFETIPFDSMDPALEALKNGEVDCLFPVNLGMYDCEERGIMSTMPAMDTEMYAVVRSSDQKEFSLQDEVRVAVNRGNPNYETFLMDNYPQWEKVYFDDTAACFKGIADDEADCILVSNYRLNNTEEMRRKYKLTFLSTGTEMSCNFVVLTEDVELLSVLNKTIDLTPSTMVNAWLSEHSGEDVKVTFTGFLRDNFGIVMTIAAAILLGTLTLVLLELRAERKVNESQQLLAVVETDDLTGLYNKSFFFEYANRRYHSEPEKKMDAIVLDIEQFHSVNELSGHEFGDLVLRTLSDEIRAFLSETDGLAGRIGPDRFDIYCASVDNYQALLDRFQGAIDRLDESVSICLRMGVMPWQRGADPLRMFEGARAANSMVRGQEKHLLLYKETMRLKERKNQQLRNDLARALADREFVVYYQPQYDIRGEKPQLVGAEALIRWQHPELGMVPPSDFIPLFEGGGQIYEIDKFVWEETARQLADWKERFGVSLSASVNLSRVDVLHPDLEKTLDELFEKYKLQRGAIKLEITESAYVDNAEQLSEIIVRLREKGFEIEMDDFGTGYSSLNMLAAMPLDVLKMDREFIRNIEFSEKDLRVVECVLNIAAHLDVAVIAEGVETQKQLAILKNVGCAFVQGYVFSRPLPAKDFEKLMKREMEE